MIKSDGLFFIVSIKLVHDHSTKKRVGLVYTDKLQITNISPSETEHRDHAYHIYIQIERWMK